MYLVDVVNNVISTVNEIVKGVIFVEVVYHEIIARIIARLFYH